MLPPLILLCLAIGMTGDAADGCWKYVRQDPPGAEVRLFAPGLISTPAREAGVAFTPDGREIYFSRFDPSHGYVAMVTSWNGAEWGVPRTAPFSGQYSDVDMFITGDGRRMFYISKRPLRRGEPPSTGYRIFVMRRDGRGWRAPESAGQQINEGTRQLYPTQTGEGTLFFSSIRKGTSGSDIFRAAANGGEFEPPVQLGSAINSAFDETDALVAPDESYLIFTSVGRVDGFGGGDLYISYRLPDGSWSPARNMGESINTSSSEYCPALSPDERYFFFTSDRSGNDEIYWVSAEIIESYRPE